MFVQFCANNPDTLLEASRLVEDQCDYIDINFGYPSTPLSISLLISFSQFSCSVANLRTETSHAPPEPSHMLMN